MRRSRSGLSLAVIVLAGSSRCWGWRPPCSSWPATVDPRRGQVQLKPSTFARYELILRKQVLPTWERMPLSKVTFTDVGVGVHELSASHLSPASVRQAHREFSLLPDHAVHDGRLARNPAKGVRG